MYESIRKIILVLTALPLLASSNTDCGGKAFHCVNSTHFMICVDLGGGVSSTIDSYIIPCPPSTVCQETNHFECEFPLPTTSLPVIGTSVRSDLEPSDVHYENIIGTLPLDKASATDPTVSIPTLQDQSVTNSDMVTPTIESTTIPVDYSIITTQTIYFGNANSDFAITQGEMITTTDAIRVAQSDYTKGFAVTDSTISILDIVNNISQDSSTLTTGNIPTDDITNKPNKTPVHSMAVDIPTTTTTIKSYTPQPDITTRNVIPATESSTVAENNTDMTAFGEATSTGSTIDAALTDILNESLKTFSANTFLNVATNSATEITTYEQTLSSTNIDSNSTDTFNVSLKGTTTGLSTEWKISGIDLKRKLNVTDLLPIGGTTYDTTETNASTLKGTTTDDIKTNKDLDEFLTTSPIAKQTTTVTASDTATQNLMVVTDAQPQSITNTPVTVNQSEIDANNTRILTSSLGINNSGTHNLFNLLQAIGGNHSISPQRESKIFSPAGYLDTPTAILEAVTGIPARNTMEDSQLIDVKKYTVGILGFGNGQVTEETIEARTQASNINNGLHLNSIKSIFTTGSEMYESTPSVAVSDSTTQNLLKLTNDKPQNITYYDEKTFFTSTPLAVSKSTTESNYNNIPTASPGLEDISKSNSVYSDIIKVGHSTSFPQPESTTLPAAGILDTTLNIVEAVTNIYSGVTMANSQVIDVNKNNITNIDIFDAQNGHVTEKTTMATTEALLQRNISLNSTQPTFTTGSEMNEPTTSGTVSDSTIPHSLIYNGKTNFFIKAPVAVNQSTIESNYNSLRKTALGFQDTSTSKPVNSDIATVRDNSSSSQLQRTNLLNDNNLDSTKTIFEAVIESNSENLTENNLVKNERTNSFSNIHNFTIGQEIKEHITTEKADQDATKRHMLGVISVSTTIPSQDIIISQTIISDVTEPTFMAAHNLSTSNRLNIVEKALDTTETSLSKNIIQQADTTQSYHENTGISDLSTTKLLIDKTNTHNQTEKIVQQKIAGTTETIPLNNMFLTNKNIRTNNSLHQNGVLNLHNESFYDDIVTHNSEVLSDTTQITQSSATEFSTTTLPAGNIHHESLSTNIYTDLRNNMTKIIHRKTSNHSLNHVNLTTPSTIIENKTEVYSVTDTSLDFFSDALSVLNDSHSNKALTSPENDPNQSINREKLHSVTHIQDNHLGISAQLLVPTNKPESINAKHVEELNNILLTTQDFTTPLDHFELKHKNKIGIATTYPQATPIYLLTPKNKKADNIAAQDQNAGMSPAAIQEAPTNNLLFYEVTTNTNYAEIPQGQLIAPEVQVETGITATMFTAVDKEVATMTSQWENKVTKENQLLASIPDLQVTFGNRLNDFVVTEPQHANNVKDDFISEPENQLINRVFTKISTIQPTTHKIQSKEGSVVNALNREIARQPSEGEFSSSAANVQHTKTKAATVIVNSTLKDVFAAKEQPANSGQERIVESSIIEIIQNTGNAETLVPSINFYENLGDGNISDVQQTQNASTYAITPDGAIKDQIANITQQNSTETHQVGLFLSNGNDIAMVSQSTSTTSQLNTENNKKTQYAVFTRTQLPKIENGMDNKSVSNKQITESTSPLAISTNGLENKDNSEIEWQFAMPENQFGYTETTTITSTPLLTPKENDKNGTATITDFEKIEPNDFTTPKWENKSVTETQNILSYITNAGSSGSTIRKTERTLKVNHAQHYLSNNSMKRILQTPKDPSNLYCRTRLRGRYSDPKDCTKFYICIGPYEPIIGKCPANTVFSDLNKQCTKNKSHCMRENEFQCISEGRFSDILRNNVYYICIRSVNSFVRFKFQCQNGYFLNKTAVKCIKHMESLQQSISIDYISKSEISVSEKKESKEIKKGKSPNESEKTSDEDFECEKEGKFPFPNDCRQYYVCTKNKKSEFRRKRKSCDSDEVFHKDKKKCVDEDSHEC